MAYTTMQPDPNSIVDTLSSHGIDSSQANRATLYEKAGLGTAASYKAAGANNASQNTALNAYYTTGAGKPTSSAIVTSGASTSNYNNQATNVNNINTGIKNSLSPNNLDGTPKIDPNTQNPDGTPKVDPNTQNPDGSKKTPDPAPADTVAITASDGIVYHIPKGMDPTIAKQQADLFAQDKANLVTNQATIASLRNYDVNTDPGAVAAVQRITEGFNVLIKQTQDKNKILLGQTSTSIARYGGLGQMNADFTSDQIDKATGRVADLQTKMNAAIDASNAAYKSGNVKALDAAQKNYEQSMKDTQSALSDLEKQISDTVKSNQAEAKIQAKADNDAIINSQKISNSIAGDVANQLKGITDPKEFQTKLDGIISGIKDRYGVDVDPATLKSAVDKINLSTANTNSIITKRNKAPVGKGTSGKNYTATNIPDKVLIPLLDDIKKGKATKDDLFRLYPEVSTSYINSSYNQYHPTNAVVNPFTIDKGAMSTNQ